MSGIVLPGGVQPQTQIMVGVIGLTLRDWFAGQVVAAVVSRASGEQTDEDIARVAYEVADCLVEARKCPPASRG